MTEKPTEEIEVTDEMIDAGTAAYRSLDWRFGGEDEMVEAIFKAMVQASPVWVDAWLSHCARLAAEAEIRTDERKKIATFVANFPWTLPLYGPPTDETDRQKWAAINEASDDAACSVCEQISAAILEAS